MYQRSELDYLIYNDPIAYADFILNGNPEAYLKVVTEYRPLLIFSRPKVNSRRAIICNFYLNICVEALIISSCCIILAYS